MQWTDTLLVMLGDWMAEERQQHHFEPHDHLTTTDEDGWDERLCKECLLTQEAGQHDTSIFPRNFDYTFQRAHSVTLRESQVFFDGDPTKHITYAVEPGDVYSAWR